MTGVLAKKRAQIDALAARYPQKRSLMLPLCWMVQQEVGWVPQWAMQEIADELGVTVAEVYEVVSFYTMFQQHPVGKLHIALCDTLACAICGTFEIADYLEQKYGIKKNKVTEDGRFSLELVECIGACSMAPAALFNEDLHGNLTPAKLDALLAAVN